jgi:hypothetical protein
MYSYIFLYHCQKFIPNIPTTKELLCYPCTWILYVLMVFTYIINAQIGFGLSMNISWIGAAILIGLFFRAAKKARANNLPLEEDVTGWKAA